MIYQSFAFLDNKATEPENPLFCTISCQPEAKKDGFDAKLSFDNLLVSGG